MGGIWRNPITHNKHSAWLQKIKEKENERISQRFLEITTSTVRNELKRIHNWKAPDLDEVHSYWLKNFRALHQRMAEKLQHCINNHQAPE